MPFPWVWSCIIFQIKCLSALRLGRPLISKHHASMAHPCLLFLLCLSDFVGHFISLKGTFWQFRQYSLINPSTEKAHEHCLSILTKIQSTMAELNLWIKSDNFKQKSQWNHDVRHLMHSKCMFVISTHSHFVLRALIFTNIHFSVH